MPWVGFTCHVFCGWASGSCGSVSQHGGSGDPTEDPSLCSASSGLSPAACRGFYAPARGGEAGSGAAAVLGGWSTDPFPDSPSRLDAMMMDGRRVVALGWLGASLIPYCISGYTGLGRDSSLWVSLSPSCHTSGQGEMGGCSDHLSPLGKTRPGTWQPLVCQQLSRQLPSTPGIKAQGGVEASATCRLFVQSLCSSVVGEESAPPALHPS